MGSQSLKKRRNAVPSHFITGVCVSCHVVELYSKSSTRIWLMAVPCVGAVRKNQQRSVDGRNFDGIIFKIIRPPEETQATFLASPSGSRRIQIEQDSDALCG